MLPTLRKCMSPERDIQSLSSYASSKLTSAPCLPVLTRMPFSSKCSRSKCVPDLYIGMATSMLRFSTVATPTLTTGFWTVRFNSTRKFSSPKKVNWLKRNSSKRVFSGKVDGASSCVKTSIEKVHTSAFPRRSAKQRCVSSQFFELKKKFRRHYLPRRKALCQGVTW